jgi:Beta protein
MLEAYSYLPILYSKNAELKAIDRLDTAIKARILPVLGVRPGQHHNFYDSVDKFKALTKMLRVAITLDETKFGLVKAQPAGSQFGELFDPTGGYTNFFNFVEQWDAAIPVLQSKSGRYLEAETQVANARALDRGLLIRVRRNEYEDFAAHFESGIFHNINHAFIIDGEWNTDVLQLERWMSDVIDRITAIAPESEIVCASSSFPRDFSNVEGRGVILNDDRELFDRIRRRHNVANLKYGDWGSTRTASEDRSSAPRPRVDIATVRDWVTFRQKKGETGGFPAVSAKATQDSVWLSTPDCWGKRVIELTSLDRPQRIKGTEVASAARINIHLTVQAMAGIMAVLPEEPFTDDF